MIVVLSLNVVACSDTAQSDRTSSAIREDAALLSDVFVADAVAPTGAERVSRTDFRGDGASDGPAIEWRYRFSGNSAAFLAEVSTKLTQDGWASEPAGNVPGQLANFGRTVRGKHILLSVFEPRGEIAEFMILAHVATV